MATAHVLETRREGLKPSLTDFRMALMFHPRRGATVSVKCIVRHADMTLLTTNGNNNSSRTGRQVLTTPESRYVRAHTIGMITQSCAG